MKNLSTWLLVFFMIMFWAFRVAVAVSAQLLIDFGGITPLNLNLEIVLLFAVLVCIVLIIKRKMIGALLYLIFHGMYFGLDIANTVTRMLESEAEIGMAGADYLNTFISFIGIILPIAVLFDMIVDKSRKLNPKDKKTDWFYTNEEYDRNLDERADKNNYRTM